MRSSHTRFVLHEPLGQQKVKNCDGSWTGCGTLIGVPVAFGDERRGLMAGAMASGKLRANIGPYVVVKLGTSVNQVGLVIIGA